MSDEKIIEGFQPGARPICVFCSAPWSDEMIRVYEVDAQHGDGSYDFGANNCSATIDISCATCGRLIYRKEFNGDGDGSLS